MGTLGGETAPVRPEGRGHSREARLPAHLTRSGLCGSIFDLCRSVRGGGRHLSGGTEVTFRIYSQSRTLFCLNRTVLNFRTDFPHSGAGRGCVSFCGYVHFVDMVCRNLCCLLFCRLNMGLEGWEMMRELGPRMVSYIIVRILFGMI